MQSISVNQCKSSRKRTPLSNLNVCKSIMKDLNMGENILSDTCIQIHPGFEGFLRACLNSVYSWPYDSQMKCFKACIIVSFLFLLFLFLIPEERERKRSLGRSILDLHASRGKFSNVVGQEILEPKPQRSPMSPRKGCPQSLAWSCSWKTWPWGKNGQ